MIGTTIPEPPRPSGSPPPPPKRPRFQRSIASVRNVAASYAGTAAESVAFLLLTPFLVRNLGIEVFGLWGLAVSLTDWIQLLDFGLREAILKFAAAHQARADAPAVRRLADAALWIYLLASILSVAVGLGLSRFVLPALIPAAGDLPEVQVAELLSVGISVRMGAVLLACTIRLYVPAATEIGTDTSKFSVLDLRLARPRRPVVAIVLIRIGWLDVLVVLLR